MQWSSSLLLEFFRSYAIYLQGVGSIILLSFFIIASTILQKNSLDRSLELLKTTAVKIKKTALYLNADLYMERRSEAAKNMSALCV
jgi:hypothetical protein